MFWVCTPILLAGGQWSQPSAPHWTTVLGSCEVKSRGASFSDQVPWGHCWHIHHPSPLLCCPLATLGPGNPLYTCPYSYLHGQLIILLWSPDFSPCLHLEAWGSQGLQNSVSSSQGESLCMAWGSPSFLLPSLKTPFSLPTPSVDPPNSPSGRAGIKVRGMRYSPQPLNLRVQP